MLGRAHTYTCLNYNILAETTHIWRSGTRGPSCVCDYDIYIAESYGSEQIWTCMVIPSTIMVTACAVVAQSTSLGHLYMPQVRWSEYQNGFTGYNLKR